MVWEELVGQENHWYSEPVKGIVYHVWINRSSIIRHVPMYNAEVGIESDVFWRRNYSPIWFPAKADLSNPPSLASSSFDDAVAACAADLARRTTEHIVR